MMRIDTIIVRSAESSKFIARALRYHFFAIYYVRFNYKIKPYIVSQKSVYDFQLNTDPQRFTQELISTYIAHTNTDYKCH
jgi:hypothetical protein